MTTWTSSHTTHFHTSRSFPSTGPIIYLDYQATTPCDPRVVAEMLPFFTEKFGNPHSRNHPYGWEAEDAIENARIQVAKVIGATSPKDIIFTSGATEANNLAIKGACRFLKDRKNHIITCATEHKCVLASLKSLEQEGFHVTYLPVQASGRIDLHHLKEALQENTALVSIMAVHNEIGTIQDLRAIGALCREYGVLFHTDAAQALGKIPLDVEAMHIDLMSLSGHKIYGPKGIGALYVRRSKPRVRMHAILTGGGQERGMRSGTLPTPLCVGFGKAVELAETLLETEHIRLKKLQSMLYEALIEALPDIYLNGSLEHRIPGNLNISFAYVEGEGLMMALKDIALSSGSACTSESLESSYVLRALGVEDDLAHTSLRISFGRFTTEEEVLYVGKRIIEAVTRLRAMSPLWEMKQEGIDLSAIQWSGH